MVNKKKKSSAKKNSTKNVVSKQRPAKKQPVKKRVSKKTTVQTVAKSKKTSRSVKKKITRPKSAGRQGGKKTKRDDVVGHTLVLSSVLGTNNATGLHSRFSKILSQKQDVTIDASAVKMVDTAILQLLLAFVKKIESSSYKVIWVKPSEEFTNRASLLNLSDALGLNVVGR